MCAVTVPGCQRLVGLVDCHPIFESFLCCAASPPPPLLSAARGRHKLVGEMTPSRRACGAAVALLLCFLLSGGAHGTRAPLPSVKTVAKLERPVHWVGGAHVHGNRTQDTEVLTGVLSLDGRYGLVVRHDHLPQLAPIKTTFTVRGAPTRTLSLPCV